MTLRQAKQRRQWNHCMWLQTPVYSYVRLILNNHHPRKQRGANQS
jgi:hypothetical protein